MALINILGNIVGNVTGIQFNILSSQFGCEAELYRSDPNTPQGFLSSTYSSSIEVMTKIADIKILPLTLYVQKYSDISADFYQDIEILTDYKDVKQGDILKFFFLGKQYQLQVHDLETYFPSDTFPIVKLICKE